jgi:hypothetical protein
LLQQVGDGFEFGAGCGGHNRISGAKDVSVRLET